MRCLEGRQRLLVREVVRSREGPVGQCSALGRRPMRCQPAAGKNGQHEHTESRMAKREGAHSKKRFSRAVSLTSVPADRGSPSIVAANHVKEIHPEVDFGSIRRLIAARSPERYPLATLASV